MLTIGEVVEMWKNENHLRNSSKVKVVKQSMILLEVVVFKCLKKAKLSS